MVAAADEDLRIDNQRRRGSGRRFLYHDGIAVNKIAAGPRISRIRREPCGSRNGTLSTRECECKHSKIACVLKRVMYAKKVRRGVTRNKSKSPPRLCPGL